MTYRSTWLGLLAAFGLSVLLAACAIEAEMRAMVQTEPAAAPTAAESGFGSYLAGRYARATRDTRAAADYFLEALAEDPDNVQLLRRAFLMVLADGRFDLALEQAPRLLRADPDDAIAPMALAAAAIRARDYPRALRHIETAPTGGFNSLMAPVVHAWVRSAQGDTDGALAALAPLAEQTGFASFYAYHKALLNEAGNRTLEAETAYRDLLERTASGTLRVVEAYGRLLERQGRRDDARALYADYLRRNPDNVVVGDAMTRLAAPVADGSAFAARQTDSVASDALGGPQMLVPNAAAGAAEAFYGAAAALSRDDSGEAVDIYAQLALYLRPDLAPARMLLGELLESRKRWADAIETYRAVAANAPQGGSARIRTAWALHELDRDEEAIAMLRAVAGERRERTDALVALGDILRAKERHKEAAVEYGRAIQRIERPEERHWTLFYSRGIAHERAKDWPKAEADLLRALELRPDQPLALNYLGYSWVDQGLRLEEARKMLERAVELRPNDGYIIDSMGWALYRLGQFDRAVGHLERAVELRPQDAVINDHLGDAYWRVGRVAEARFQWRRSLGLKPDSELIPEIEKKLEFGLAAPATRDGG